MLMLEINQDPQIEDVPKGSSVLGEVSSQFFVQSSDDSKTSQSEDEVLQHRTWKQITMTPLGSESDFSIPNKSSSATCPE